MTVAPDRSQHTQLTTASDRPGVAKSRAELHGNPISELLGHDGDAPRKRVNEGRALRTRERGSDWLAKHSSVPAENALNEQCASVNEDTTLCNEGK